MDVHQERKSGRGYRIVQFLLAILICALVLVLLLSAFLVDGVDIDINSGRTRKWNRIGRQQVEDTRFSEFVSAHTFEKAAADWRCVSRKSWLRPISPYYQYHTTVGDLERCMVSFDVLQFSQEKKLQEALRILRLLREGTARDVKKAADTLECQVLVQPERQRVVQ